MSAEVTLPHNGKYREMGLVDKVSCTSGCLVKFLLHPPHQPTTLLRYFSSHVFYRTHHRALHRSRTTTVATEHSHQHFNIFSHDAFFFSPLSPNTVIPQRSSQLFTGTKNTHTPHPPAPTPLVPQPRTTTCVETYLHSNVVRGPVCCDQRIDDGGAALL